MQLSSQNFFPTELPTQPRYSDSHDLPDTTKSSHKNPSIRIRQIKSQMKRASQLYKQSLTSYIRTKNNVNKATQQTNKLRHNFLKLYSNRKIKLVNKSLLEENQQMCEQNKLDRKNRARSLKLTNQLNLAYTRNQAETNNLKAIEDNRKDQQIFRKTLRVRRNQEFQQSKNKYEKIKKDEQMLSARKDNYMAIQATKARHNYLLKINRQLQMLQDYKGLLEKVNGLNTSFNGQLFNTAIEGEANQFNKSFFVTTRNSFN